MDGTHEDRTHYIDLIPMNNALTAAAIFKCQKKKTYFTNKMFFCNYFTPCKAKKSLRRKGLLSLSEYNKKRY